MWSACSTGCRTCRRRRCDHHRLSACIVPRPPHRPVDSPPISSCGRARVHLTNTSARAMLQAIIAGEEDVALLADLAKGRMRTKRAALEQALTGRVRDHHRFLLAQHLTHLDFLDEQIETFNHHIAATIAAQAANVSALPQPPDDPTGSAPTSPAGDATAPERPMDWT